MASPSPQAKSGTTPYSTRQKATRIRGGAGTDPSLKRLPGSPLTRATNSAVARSNKVVLRANSNSSLVHPSDFINAALLKQNPYAKVAVTHDNVWCDLLRDNFPKRNHATLINVARSYTNTVDAYGCVSLETTRISDPSNDEKRLSYCSSLKTIISDSTSLCVPYDDGSQTNLINNDELHPAESRPASGTRIGSFVRAIRRRILSLRTDVQFQGAYQLTNIGVDHKYGTEMGENRRVGDKRKMEIFRRAGDKREKGKKGKGKHRDR